LSLNESLETPGKTLMLLKKASKPQKEGFKRKKVDLKVTFKKFKADAARSHAAEDRPSQTQASEVSVQSQDATMVERLS
jgi:hypothetical protein